MASKSCSGKTQSQAFSNIGASVGAGGVEVETVAWGIESERLLLTTEKSSMAITTRAAN